MGSFPLGRNQHFHYQGLYWAEYIRVQGVIGVDAEGRETREYGRAAMFKVCLLNAPFFRVSYELPSGEAEWIADFATREAAEKLRAKLRYFLDENRKVSRQRNVEEVIASILGQAVPEVPINPRAIADLAKKCYTALYSEGLVKEVPTPAKRKS